MGKRRQRPVASLTDDLVVEILSRAPVKSICRFKRVSKAWRDLIAHPDYRRKFPQTLSGFFYTEIDDFDSFPEPDLCLISPSGSGKACNPSFAFLPEYQWITILDCCNGLVLCHWKREDEFHYMVCNPATEKWVQLPASRMVHGQIRTSATRLGFDPAVSSHFHVFEFAEDFDVEHDFCYVSGVAVYSSETGGWVHKKSGWDTDVMICSASTSVFLNGRLNFLTMEPAIAAVDVEGKTWLDISVPDGLDAGFIYQSNGCLHYADYVGQDDAVQLAVYVLQDYDGKEWTLKHSIDTACLFGQRTVDFRVGFNFVAVHPECNLLYFTVGSSGASYERLMNYHMDRHQVKVICKIRGRCGRMGRYLSYVPFYSELQALHT